MHDAPPGMKKKEEVGGCWGREDKYEKKHGHIQETRSNCALLESGLICFLCGYVDNLSGMLKIS